MNDIIKTGRIMILNNKRIALNGIPDDLVSEEKIIPETAVNQKTTKLIQMQVTNTLVIIHIVMILGSG